MKNDTLRKVCLKCEVSTSNICDNGIDRVVLMLMINNDNGINNMR
jgi:hypothetical protein